jgi:hypothetical protein
MTNNPDMPCDTTDRLLFAAATSMTVGDGMRTTFWSSAWLQGQRPQDIAPNIFRISKNKNKTISEALHNRTWIKDIDLQHAGFTSQHFVEYVKLWSVLNQIQLQSDREDSIT